MGHRYHPGSPASARTVRRAGRGLGHSRRQHTTHSQRLTCATRKSLLLGTALASTLLIGILVAPAPAAAAIVTCAGDVGTGPLPITHANPDPIICVNTETRINNAGTAIYLSTTGNGSFIDLNNSGPLAAAAYGIDTYTVDDNSGIAIVNSASVTSVARDAISAFATGSGSDITINNTARLTTGVDGIYANSFYGDITINNGGPIVAGYHGIHAGCEHSASCTSGDIAITNSGSIKAGDQGILAGTGYGGDITINNSGKITAAYIGIAARTAYGFGSGDNSPLTINNTADITAGFAGIATSTGFPMDPSYGTNSPITITNSAKITAGIYGIYAGTGGDGSSISITNSGDIDPFVGIYALTFGNNARIAIDNKGTIDATYLGIEADTYGPNSSITIVNSGRVTAASTSYYGPSTAINAKTRYSNSDVVIDNSGTVEGRGAYGFGVYAVAAGPNSRILITNSGSVYGGYAAIYAIGYTGTKIVNTGDISAGPNSQLAISVYGASAKIYNSGHITGYVDLSYQADLFVNQAGGVFETKLTSYFNAGNDVFINQAGGTVQAATKASAKEASGFQGLETFKNMGTISTVDGGTGDVFTLSNTPGGKDLSFVASGSSTLAVDAFLGGPGSKADNFIVEGNVSGTTTVAVNNTNTGPGVFNPSGIKVVFVTGAVPTGNEFSLAQPVDTGFFDYDLFFTPTGSGFWDLKSYPGAGAHLLPQLVTAAQDIWHQGSSTWFDRTADLRVLLNGGGAPAAAPGVYGNGAQAPNFTPATWVRGSGSWLDRNDSAKTSAYGRTYNYNLDRELDTMDFQMGLDLGKRDFLSQGDILVFGMLGGFVHGDLDYDSILRQFDFDGGQIGAYATYLKGGLFVDTLLNVHLLEMDANGTIGFPSKTDVTTVGLRTDTGYRFGSFNGGAFLEPLATLEVTWADIDGFNLGGNQVSFDDDANVRGRLGLRAGTTTEAWEGTMMEPFVTGSLWGNFTDDNSATLVSTGSTFRYQDNLDDVWGEVSAGVNFFNVSQTTSVFAKADVTFGDDVTGLGGKAGMRVSW